MADKFLIAPFSVGLQKDIKPWLIPDEAFALLKNAYVFRGRVRKRFGSTGIGGIFGLDPKSSRLRINIGTTNGGGDLAGIVPGGGSGIGAVGQMFSIDDEFFTVTTAGAADMITNSPTATVNTYNTATGAYDIQTSLAATDVYFYPAKPVMGFAHYESTAVNEEPTYAFDTFFAYSIINDAWERLDGETAPGDSQWSGTDVDFFWSTTYRGLSADIRILFVTNYVRADLMRYFDGTNWTSWSPTFTAAGTNIIESCRIIIKFKDRLLLLNTKEKVQVGGIGPVLDKTFVNRCRFSQLGSPLDAVAFEEQPDRLGGLVDCPTKEAIISAYEFKDRLIVFFERSTWELAYTANEIRPFAWREVNIEQGVESTFSVVPFDTAILGIGQNGINACNGYNVQRIDAKIPDEVFKLHNNDDGPARVHGIRDFRAEMVYWTVPAKSGASKYPDRILAYNYNSNSWAYFDDSITAFGYYYFRNDKTWEQMNLSWEEYETSWNSYVFEEAYRTPIAGNQQGFTFIITPDLTYNAPSLQVTNLVDVAGVITFTVIDHNLQSGDWIFILEMPGITGLDGDNFKINKVNDDNFTIDEAPTVTGAYEGAGVLHLVSQIDIKTKEFNFYTPGGSKTSIEKVDFLIDKVDGSEITVDYIPSSSGISLRDEGIATGAILGNSILDLSPYVLIPMEDSQKRFWHAVYTQAQGDNIQLRLYWTDDQMKNTDITQNGFQMHAMLIHAMQTEEI